MIKTWEQIILVLATCSIYTAYCKLEIIPERAIVHYVNDKYLHNYTVHVKRFSRTSAYFFNVEMSTKQPWYNNVSLHIVLNEYLHNEYRRSFVEFHYKYCDLLNYDKFIGILLVKFGLKCPLPAGTVRSRNYNFSIDDFPNVFPFERSRVDVEFAITATNETMAKICYYLTFKNK